MGDGETPYRMLKVDGGRPIKAWVRGVELDEKAQLQLENVARMPFIHRWVAAMPDVHWGIGATVGSVIPCVGAIIPAAVGVDIGCGMMAQQTTLKAADLPDSLAGIRTAIEKAVPHGRTGRGGRSDKGSWASPPAPVEKAWKKLSSGFREIIERYPPVEKGKTYEQLGTLGTGNHFIEVCLDEEDRVWIMLHSGSRGVGNRIGTRYIGLARKDMEKQPRKPPRREPVLLPGRNRALR